MIHGHKPNGYFVTADGEGHKIEGETRQCVHCQYTWEYGQHHLAGEAALGASATERGWCLNCGGWLCGRVSCQAEQARLIQYAHDRLNQTRSCVPFEEWRGRLLDFFGGKRLDPDLTILESGLIVPRK